MKLATLAALAGTADTALFLTSRYENLKDNPQRLRGSLALAGVWGALALSSALDGQHTSRRTRTLAAVNLAAQSALLAVHVRKGLFSPRIATGATVGLITLTATLSDR